MGFLSLYLHVSHFLLKVELFIHRKTFPTLLFSTLTYNFLYAKSGTITLLNTQQMVNTSGPHHTNYKSVHIFFERITNLLNNTVLFC